MSGQKSASLKEIEIVSEDLHHLWVGASPAINGLIVFTWLQDNADDAREAPNLLLSFSDATDQKSFQAPNLTKKSIKNRGPNLPGHNRQLN